MQALSRVMVSVSMMGLAVVSGLLPANAQSPGVSDCVAKAIAAGNAPDQITALGRAKNLARQTAEAINGGLEFYRAEAAMHGPVSEAPCVDNGNGTWTFTIMGGEPAFTVPSKETVVTIDRNTWQIRVEYNGEPRS